MLGYKIELMEILNKYSMEKEDMDRIAELLNLISKATKANAEPYIS